LSPSQSLLADISFKTTDAAVRRPSKVGRSSPTISVKPVGVGGCVSAVDSEGRTIWIADAHRGNGKRFVVRADEKLTAFLELESAIRLKA
jgi:hypothetical protein